MVQIDWKAIGFVILPNIGGCGGAIITRPNVNTWYSALKKPTWTPPNCVFAPAWITLYSAMGYGSYLVYKNGGGFEGAAKLPLAIYGANVLANWAWNPIFFGLKNIKLSLIDTVVIDVTALGMAYTFSKVDRVAGILIIPYCLWLGFATALNYCMYRDNKEESEEEPKIKEI